jgi:hypothetical protein
MPGRDSTEVRLRWILWGLAVAITASIWGFGIWARRQGDADLVLAAFPYVAVAEMAGMAVFVGLVLVIRRMEREEEGEDREEK